MTDVAPVAVTVELRLLDVGPRVDRVYRVASEISARGLVVEQTIPYEAGRPLACSFTLPGEDTPLTITAIIDQPPRARGQEPSPADAVTWRDLTDDARTRLERYTRERNLTP